MIVLAVLLLVLVAAVVVFIAVAGAGEPVLLTWDALNLRWEPTALLVFAAGAVTVVALGLALALLRSGARRSSDKRRELKRLRRAEQEGALPGAGAPAPTRAAPQSARPPEHGSGPGGAGRHDRTTDARTTPDDRSAAAGPTVAEDVTGRDANRYDEPGAPRS